MEKRSSEAVRLSFFVSDCNFFLDSNSSGSNSASRRKIASPMTANDARIDCVGGRPMERGGM